MVPRLSYICYSPREYFHSYLQSLDVERASVPASFQARLTRMLAHYGVTSLERSPELETAVFRIFLAQQRMAGHAAIVSELLRQWLAAPPAEPLRERAGLALEHLIEATQRRFPAVSDLARSVVFRWFAQPLLRRNRARVYAAVRADLRYLDSHPDAPDRAERIQAMVATAEPLVRLIGQRIERASGDHAPLLEVLTRRYYGNRRLADVTARDVAGRRFVTASYSGPGGATMVAATATDIAGLPGAIAALAELPGHAASAGLVADLYLTWAGQPDADGIAARLGELLEAGSLPESVTRLAVTVGGAKGAAMHHHFTFRPGAPRAAARPGRGPADPRLAPAGRRAAAAGPAAGVRPHPAAVGGRGDLPVQGRGQEQ